MDGMMRSSASSAEMATTKGSLPEGIENMALRGLLDLAVGLASTNRELSGSIHDDFSGPEPEPTRAELDQPTRSILQCAQVLVEELEWTRRKLLEIQAQTASALI